MNHKRMLLLTIIAFLSSLIYGGSQQAALARQIVVDDDFAQCRKADFASIQSAVLAADPGDTIKVCPGTYVEQVRIPAGKDGLTLRSEGRWAAIIKVPPAMTDPKAIVHVDGAHNVTIERFTITGPGDGPCDSIEFGVLVDNGGSATIRDNHITEIHDTPFSGCQNGVGVQVGRFDSSTAPGTILPGTAKVFKNSIDNYQKNGVSIDEAGTFGEVAHNTITGIGPTAVIAQNGIQVAYGASAVVSHNEVSENRYTGDFYVATGILLFDDPSIAPGGAITVEHNKVTRNDVGIDAAGSVNPIIRFNRASENIFDGIDLFQGVTGADLSHNSAFNNGFDGIYVGSTSVDNNITKNKMLGNSRFDAEDDSAGPGTGGTANFWIKNRCETDNRGGALCDHSGGDGDEGDGGADENVSNAKLHSNASANSGAKRRRAASPTK